MDSFLNLSGKPPTRSASVSPSTGLLRGQAASPPPCREFLAEPVEAAAHARVETQRAGLEDEAADQVRVDALRRLDLAAGSLLDLVDDAARLLVGEFDGGGQLDVENAFCLSDEPVELARDLLDLAGAIFLGKQEEEVADELFVPAEQLLERCRLGALIELGVTEERPELRHLALRLDEVAELFAHGVEPAPVPRCFEEGARVHAVRDRHATRPYLTTPRSRARRSPRRSGDAGPCRRARPALPSPPRSG